MESTSYVVSFGMVFFLPYDHGLDIFRGNDTTGCTLVILRHNRVLLFIQLE